MDASETISEVFPVNYTELISRAALLNSFSPLTVTVTDSESDVAESGMFNTVELSDSSEFEAENEETVEESEPVAREHSFPFSRYPCQVTHLSIPGVWRASSTDFALAIDCCVFADSILVVSRTKLLNCSAVKVVVADKPVPVLKLLPVESVAIPSLMIKEILGLDVGPFATVKELVVAS